MRKPDSEGKYVMVNDNQKLESLSLANGPDGYSSIPAFADNLEQV